MARLFSRRSIVVTGWKFRIASRRRFNFEIVMPHPLLIRRKASFYFEGDENRPCVGQRLCVI